MRILFLGLGSIGQRNLSSCLRVEPTAEYFCARHPESRSEVPSSVSVFPLDQIHEQPPFDLAWICTPTDQHLNSLKAVAKHVRAVFIEKPIAHTESDLSEIEFIVNESGISFFYGCVFRHHPMIKAVYDLIQSGTYGKAIGYSLYCGSYLPDWRPGRDYRSLYSSSARLGGGVHIDLIHEFDFASYWFGPYQSISGRLAKVSRLEIDSIDDCASLTKHSGGVIGTVHLDYYRPVARRDFEVVFPEVVVRGDLLTSKIEIASKVGSELKDYSITREALFDRQAQAVLAAIRANEKSPWSLAECSDTNRRVLRQGANFRKNSEE